MICPNCYKVVSDSVNFCENCGAALRPEDTQQGASSATGETGSGYSQPATDSPYFAQPADQGYVAGQQYGQQPADQAYFGGQQYGQQSYGQGGYTPTPPGAYTSSTGPTASAAPFVLAIIALVTSILGLFPVSIILAIIALIMNSGQKKRGEISSKQTPTKVMSIISLVVSAIMLVMTIVIGGLAVAYLASGDYTITTDGNGNVSISTQGSAPGSSSSAAAGAAGTSASSSASAGNASAGSAAPSGSASTGSSASTASSSSASSASAASSDSSSAASSKSSAPAASTPDTLVGSWKLTGLVSDGKELSSDDIKLMQDMGMNVDLVLNADGSAAITLFGVAETGTWEGSADTGVTLTFNRERTPVTISGNQLILADGSDVLTFTKE